MAKSFELDDRDYKKLTKFFRKAPKLLKPVTANVLNSLAFKTREYDIKNLSSNMIIRNERFLKSSLRVKTAKSSSDINKQISTVGSIKRPRFTGWEEQQTGKPAKKKRSVTLAARKGNKRKQVAPKYRLKSRNKFYRPQQFQGKSLQQQFYFMLRVLGSRGGGEFLVNNNIALKRGVLRKGLYSFRKGRITKLQDLTKGPRVKRLQWRTMSIKQLQKKNDIKKIWEKSLKFIISRQGLKK